MASIRRQCRRGGEARGRRHSLSNRRIGFACHSREKRRDSLEFGKVVISGGTTGWHRLFGHDHVRVIEDGILAAGDKKCLLRLTNLDSNLIIRVFVLAFPNGVSRGCQAGGKTSAIRGRRPLKETGATYFEIGRSGPCTVLPRGIVETLTVQSKREGSTVWISSDSRQSAVRELAYPVWTEKRKD